MASGFSIDNIAFGMGSGLLQQVNRDTLNFAMKCSAIQVNGEWRDVYKQPVDQAMKVSKKGRLALEVGVTPSGQVVHTTKRLEDSSPEKNLLKPVFRNGKILKTATLAEIRERASVTFRT